MTSGSFSKEHVLKWFLIPVNKRRKDWIGDGFCDDINNDKDSDYDAGDCCGLSKKTNFCLNCTCIGKMKWKNRVEIKYFENLYFSVV